MSSLSSANPPAESPAPAIPPRLAGASDELAAAQQLADSLFAAGKLDEAARLYARILEKQPSSVEALYALGRLFKQRGQIDAAIACYRSAAALRPRAPNIHFNLASALRAAGQLKDAALSYEQVIALQPEDMEAHSNLGAVYMELGDMQAAEDSIRHALEIAPNYADAHANLANVLAERGNRVAAVAACRKALALDPRHFKARYNFARLLGKMGDMHGARRGLRSALELAPGFAEARFALSLNLLGTGHYAEGWREYESRWETHYLAHARRNLAQPQWRGEEIRGARIFLYAEQGFGDTIHFVRFVPMVAELGAEVVLEVQPGLERLLKDLHPGVQVVSQGEMQDHSSFNWQCPLLSLPLAFKVRLQTIPAKALYLAAGPIEVEHWRERFQSDSLRVGLTWAGNPNHTLDAHRSLALKQLSGLLRTPGATFYSLQKGPAAEQLTLADDLPLINLEEHLTDFADTAAILANLDLVISVDTAVAHLAAAMGKPVWILVAYQSDWRWLRDRTDSPWYPTARLFRQTAQQRWDSVLRAVQQKLTELLQSRNDRAWPKAL